MSKPMIELPSQREQDAFNLRRWDELLNDLEMMRIETDRHGQIIMSPPPSARHGTYQSKINYALRDLLTEGQMKRGGTTGRKR